jgi:uncharacterized protein (DUF427 family)
MKASWNGQVIAESDETIVVEGNHYFPADSVDSAFLRDSDTQTRCVWKGMASYYDIVVGDDVNSDAVWYYPDPSRMAEMVRDRVAFWKGVEVSE